MEESGHYYTVYLTSLAVGFNKDVAFQHALMAQMPDEVAWLDAAHIHILEAKFGEEKDFDNNLRAIPNDWRIIVESSLHALSGRDADVERKRTVDMARKYGPLSFEFGFLLHKIGDDYAHTPFGKNVMFDTNSFTYDPTAAGHGLEAGEDADFPWLRKPLYLTYVDALYDLLKAKLYQGENKKYFSSGKELSKNEVWLMFYEIISTTVQMWKEITARVPYISGVTGYITRDWFAQQTMIDSIQSYMIFLIRNAAQYKLGIPLRNDYSPERETELTLDTFLSSHPELTNNHSRREIKDAIRQAISNVDEDNRNERNQKDALYNEIVKAGREDFRRNKL